jgi:hypothetical protein
MDVSPAETTEHNGQKLRVTLFSLAPRFRVGAKLFHALLIKLLLLEWRSLVASLSRQTENSLSGTLSFIVPILASFYRSVRPDNGHLLVSRWKQRQRVLQREYLVYTNNTATFTAVQFFLLFCFICVWRVW